MPNSQPMNVPKKLALKTRSGDQGLSLGTSRATEELNEDGSRDQIIRSSSSAIPDSNLLNPVEVDYAIQFPVVNSDLDQDEEWCEVNLDGQWQKIRFHDYDQIFSIPGLYEAIFYKALKCCSPTRVRKLLAEELEEAGISASSLRFLDVGAGNGMMGEQLRLLGVKHVVGADILPEAKVAALRDRPVVYADYLIADLTDLSDEERRRLEQHRFNGMTTVAALGFGDMPPRAFATAYNLVEAGGWLAFNVKETFVKGSDESGFSRLIRMMTEWELLDAHVYRRYCHRLSMDKQPLYYVAFVARKVRDIPEALLLALD